MLSVDNGCCSEELRLLEERMLLHGFTAATRKTYRQAVSQFLRFCRKSSLNPSKTAVKYYLISIGGEPATARVYNAALRFYFGEVLHKPFSLEEIPLKKKAKKLPRTLTKKEIMAIINAVSNEKHRLVIKMLYSTGLRLSELVSLKRSDIDVERNLVHVRRGKGRKERTTVIARSLLS